MSLKNSFLIIRITVELQKNYRSARRLFLDESRPTRGGIRGSPLGEAERPEAGESFKNCPRTKKSYNFRQFFDFLIIFKEEFEIFPIILKIY